MRRLRIQSPLLDKTFKTSLSADYNPSSSDVDLSVISSNSFTMNDVLIIGEPTEERTEWKTLSSVPDIDSLTLSAALNFAHAKGTPIYKSPWSQVSIESRATSNSVFSIIATVDIQWDNKSNETVYYDNSGLDSTQYRFRFYNSVTSAYAEYSPIITGAGFTRNQVGYMIRKVREISNDKERKIVTDDEIIRFFNTAQDIIYGHNPKYYFLKVDTYKQGNGISTIAGTSVYDLDHYSDFGHLDRIRYYISSGATQQIYDLMYRTPVEFDSLTQDLNLTGDDYPSEYTLIPPDSDSEQGYIQINPPTLTTGVGVLYPIYYKKMATLDTVDDETPVALPNLLESYAISQVEKIKGDETKAAMYDLMFKGTAPKRTGYEVAQGLALLDQLDQANKRPQGQPRNLWNFRGQKGAARMFSSGGSRNADWYRENEF